MSSFFTFWNSEDMSDQAYTKFGDFSAQTTACGSDDLSLLFALFWAENWISADLIAFEEPVFVSRSENMITLIVRLCDFPGS